VHDGLQPVSLLTDPQAGEPHGDGSSVRTAPDPAVIRSPAPPAPPHRRGRRAEPAGSAPVQASASAFAPRPPALPPDRQTSPPAEPEQAPPAGRLSVDDLTAERLLRGRRPAPATGWRRTVFYVSFGWVNLGESPAELRRRELLARAQAPIAGSRRVAVLSAKGGVGKTSTAIGLGATAASVRGDRVIAVDANPDLGTLGERVRRQSTATVRDLLRDAARIQRYPDVRSYTSQADSRLEVLAADRDPALSEAFSEDDYRQVVDLLGRFYNLIVTDCGTGLLHSAMAGVLGVVDQVVLVAAPAVDGARSAAATLDWLDAHGRSDLVSAAVVVVSTVRRGGDVDVDRVLEHFAGRCRTVLQVPFDPHLATGAEFDLDALRPATRQAYLELTAAVADGFTAQCGR